MPNWPELAEQIEAGMKKARVPGFALAIVQEQEIIYAKGFGLTAIDGDEAGLPVTPQTLFRIGSVRKSLTGTAVMRLVDSGQLNLDQPIRTYIPWIALGESGAADIITLRMLMSHTSGLRTAVEQHGSRAPSGLVTFIRE